MYLPNLKWIVRGSTFANNYNALIIKYLRLTRFAPRFVLHRLRCQIAAIALSLLIGTSSAAFAQLTTSEVFSSYQNRIDVADTMTAKLYAQRQSLPASAQDIQPLEKTVDPNTYVLGPGDGLYLNVYAIHSLDQNLSVTPEGRLLIPNMGPVDVAGLTISEAQKKVIDFLKRDYKSPDASLSLRRLRPIKISLLGDVISPGVQSALALQRVSEIIDRAGGVRSTSSLRNIEIRNLSGAVRAKADLFRYYALGDLSANPVVESGDVIVVPSATRFVSLSGGLTQPQRMEYVDGEKLGNAIALCRGLLPAAITDSIEIVRFEASDPSVQDHRFVNFRDGENPPLRDGDVVFIRSMLKYHVAKMAGIGGEVNYPGRYPIEVGTTRIKDILQRSGGLLSTASIEQAVLIRRVGINTWENDPEFRRLNTLAPLRKEGLSEEEYTYLLARYSQFSRSVMVVDFKALLAGDESQNLLLREEDSIAVPRALGFVTVSGSVNSQGNIEYIPGGSYADYIAKAGGYASTADRSAVRVVNPKTSSYIDPRSEHDYKIAPGDLIIVPQEHSEFWKDVGTATIFTAQILSIITGLYLFFKKP